MKLLRAGAIGAAPAALLSAGALVAALQAPASLQTRSGETFADKVGDATPDITTVAISHDEAGMITMSITIVGLSAPVTEGVRHVSVYLEPDDDTSPATPPYMLASDESPTGSGCMLLKWDGSSFRAPASGQGSALCSRGGDVLTWKFTKADIGAHDLFSTELFASQQRSDGTIAGQDRAPDFGRWGYYFNAATTTTTTTASPTAPAPAVTPVIGRPVAVPSRPVAGRRFTLAFPVTRSDTGRPLTVGTIKCDPMIGGRVLPHDEQFESGKVRVTIRVPASGKGKTLRLQLTISSKGHSATRSAVFRVNGPR